MDIIFEINGKRIDISSLSNPIQKGVLVEIEKSLKETLGNVKCPIHHEKPTVIVAGPALDRLSYNIDGCCEKLIEAVKKKLASKNS